jgi:hypothetical protein
VKLRLSGLKIRRRADSERRWPGYLFGGRARTTTVVLILAFVGVWWAYDTYRSTPEPAEAPQVVPPGYVPDPNFTWVPRARLQQPPVTVTETATPPTVTQTVRPAPPPEFAPPPPGAPAPTLEPGQGERPGPGRGPVPGLPPGPLAPPPPP